MKIKLLFLLISALLTLHAQTVSLEWAGAKAHSVDYENKINLPFFNNEGYSVYDNIPYFNYSESTTGMGKVSIENIQYSILNSSERGQLNSAQIPTTLEYDARIQKGGNEYFLTVNMNPFVKEGNQIKKVISFQIVNQQGVPPDYQPEETYDPATQSVLRSGNWYKIKIKKSGVFRLDRAFFAQNGIPTNFDPRTLKIYGNGGKMLNENPGDFRYGALQENAIQFNGEEDGSFDGSDFILFYGQGPHDWNRKSNSTLSNLSHRFNVYSDDAYYFITFGGQNGKRVQDVEISGNPTQTFNQYHEYVFHEKDSINLNQIGRQWGGEPFNLEPARTFTLTGNAPAASGIQGYAKYRLLSKQGQGAIYSGSVNGTLLGTGTVPSSSGQSSYQNNFRELERELAFSPSGNVFNFNIEINNATNPSAYILLDYLEVRYTANLTFNGTQMNFRRLENLNDGNVYGFSISGAQKIWNISDITTASNVIGSGNIFKYQSNSPYFFNEFIAFNESAAITEIEYAGSVINQDLRSLSDIDYAIVVHPDYLSEASRLANFRQQNDNVKVAVVTTDQVYNDFSSGAQDISAIRDFFKHLRDTGSPLKYTLLFGGGSYDVKNRILNNTHYVPTYQSFESADLKDTYVTDDFFTMLDDTDLILTSGEYLNYGTGYSYQMDIAVGRLPAHSPSEAKVMVDKIIAYYNKQPNQGTSFGDWRTKFYLVVDDDLGRGPFHTTVENTAAQFIENNIEYATLRKLYLDAFPLTGTSGGGRYPQVNQGIVNAFDLGSALIVYFGHGGPRSWSQKRIITYEEINNFSNFSGLYSRLPVVLTITCDFTVWDVPELASAGEYMFKNPNGGAAAMLTTSRPIGVFYGENFNEQIVEKVLALNGESYLPLGEALRQAKLSQAGGRYHYSVNLIGDPMLSITRPPREIRITKINGEDAANFTGLLRAMDFVEIEGEVLNVNGTAKDASFNGKANATLFDKPVNRTTLNNRGTLLPILNYQEQISAIFKGGTNVANGEFKFQFYVPKDINYEIGDGKLTVYAHNNVTDAVTTKTVRVGDQNPNGLQDDDGPTIGLYMNNLNFVDGGITDRDPYILACLLDNTGINTSGVAIGHDITGVVDGNVESTYVLNEYYEGGDNNPCTNPQFLDYQKGQVMYKLSRLELGSHQIVFKAWDINNNSSEQTLDFVVMENGSDHIYIEKLLNWPNPFTNQTYFHFEHNCDTELDVMVQIFTISGKLVKTIRQPVSAEPWREGYRTGRFAIPWDGLDDFGDKIGKGVYIYRVTAKGVDSEQCKGSATAIEKLVILK